MMDNYTLRIDKQALSDVIILPTTVEIWAYRWAQVPFFLNTVETNEMYPNDWLTHSITNFFLAIRNYTWVML